MTGWKTNTGAIMFAIGGVLVAFAGKCPIENAPYWMELAGQILMALGGGLGAVGIGSKLDANTAAVQQVNKQ
jgi:hypothetical protein